MDMHAAAGAKMRRRWSPGWGCDTKSKRYRELSHCLVFPWWWCFLESRSPCPILRPGSGARVFLPGAGLCTKLPGGGAHLRGGWKRVSSSWLVGSTSLLVGTWAPSVHPAGLRGRIDCPFAHYLGASTGGCLSTVGFFWCSVFFSFFIPPFFLFFRGGHYAVLFNQIARNEPRRNFLNIDRSTLGWKFPIFNWTTPLSTILSIFLYRTFLITENYVQSPVHSICSFQKKISFLNFFALNLLLLMFLHLFLVLNFFFLKFGMFIKIVQFVLCPWIQLSKIGKHYNVIPWLRVDKIFEFFIF